MYMSYATACKMEDRDERFMLLIPARPAGVCQHMDHLPTQDGSLKHRLPSMA